MSDHAYTNHDHGYAASWRRIHGNSEETHVFVIERNDDYMAVALDIDPRDWSAVASDAICYEPTLESAIKKAQTWMREHPKGIASSKSGSGAMAKLWGILKKFDQSASDDLQSIGDNQ